MKTTRRNFIKSASLTVAGLELMSATPAGFISRFPGIQLSLAEWSLHRALWADEITNLDFPRIAANNFGIYGVEYVSTFFESTEDDYLNELLTITKDHDVQNVLIMVDGEGSLGDASAANRAKSVEQHHRWVEAAKFLGCHSIRVNARGDGSEQEVADATVESLSDLAEFAAPYNINVIVENHGGYSSNGQWLSGVMSRVGMENCGTLPDFGNFNISNNNQYDRYQGVQELMPFAKGVSAKSYNFDENGNETTMDFYRLMQIVRDSGYTGWVGVEYEGSELSEPDGIRATKNLLEKVIAEL